MAFKCTGEAVLGASFDASAFNGNTATRYAFCGWIRPETDSSYRRILHLNVTTSGSSDSFQITKNTDNTISAVWQDGNSVDERRNTDAAVVSGEWIHVFGYCGFGQVPQFWVNGVPQTNTANKVSYAQGSSGKFNVGMRTDNTSYFKGDIAEVAMWLRGDDTMPAPTTDQVIAIMNGAPPWLYQPDNLQIVAPYQSLDNDSPGKVQSPIFNKGLPETKLGYPALAEHAPIKSSNIIFLPGSVNYSFPEILLGAASV